MSTAQPLPEGALGARGIRAKVAARPAPDCRGTNGLTPKTGKTKWFPCPSWETARKVCVAGRGPGGPKLPKPPIDVLFVGEAPGPREDREGVAFMGKPGAMLDSAIEAILPRGASWYMTYAARCFPGYRGPSLAKPPAAALRACYWHLAKEVEYLQPSLIVPMGPAAVAQVRGIPLAKATVKGHAGLRLSSRFQDSSGKPIPMIAVHHPGWVVRNDQAHAPVWATELEQIQKHLMGKLVDVPERTIHVTTDPSEMINAYEELRVAKPKLVAFDIETTGLTFWNSELRMIGHSVADSDEATVCILEDLSENDLITVLRHLEMAHNAVGMPVWHHAIFDLGFLLGKGLDLTQRSFNDTKIFGFLADENAGLSLDFLIRRYVPQLAGFKGDTALGNVAELPTDKLAQRCGLDVIATVGLHQALTAKVTGAQQQLARRVLAPATATLARMHVRGWWFSRERAKATSDTMEENKALLKETIVKTFAKALAREINPDSPKQLAEGLMALGIDDHERQAANSSLISTAKDVLSRHRDEHPVLLPLIEFSTVKGHLRKIRHYEEHLDGPWLHPFYNLAGSAEFAPANSTVTCRPSSARPNLFNIPAPLRALFCSRHGRSGRIVQADYSQLELRILAALAGEESLLVQFRDPDGDPHQAAADRIREITGREVDRQIGKRINFASGYGAGPKTIYEQIKGDALKFGQDVGDLTLDDIEVMFDAWWEAHENIRGWVRNIHRMVRQQGYIENVLGQRRHLPDAQSDNFYERSRAERQAANFCIQSVGALITDYGMVLADQRLADVPGAAVFGQYYDSVWVDAPGDRVQQATTILVDSMLDAGELFPEVLLAVDVKVGYDGRGPLKIGM